MGVDETGRVRFADEFEGYPDSEDDEDSTVGDGWQDFWACLWTGDGEGWRFHLGWGLGFLVAGALAAAVGAVVQRWFQ